MRLEEIVSFDHKLKIAHAAKEAFVKAKETKQGIQITPDGPLFNDILDIVICGLQDLIDEDIRTLQRSGIQV